MGRKLAYYKESHRSCSSARKEICIEVNDEKLKCVLMSREQHAGENHDLNVGNKSFERVKQIKYLGQP